MNAQARPGLIETMRLRKDGSIDRLSLHLSRLQQSAQALDIALDAEQVSVVIRSHRPDSEDQRLRLELSSDGRILVTAHPLVETGTDKPWQLCVAATRIDAGDPLLRHKTTRRGIYVKARQEFPVDVADEVLLLNGDGAVCEGTITTVFVEDEKDAVLKTPALDCGLLRGVLRQELLYRGQAVEAVLSVDDLRSAHRLYVGNSLRGLLPALLRE